MSASDLAGELTTRSMTLSQLADPTSIEELLVLLRSLYDAGRRDLPLGRLLEGHVDALQIVGRYGSATQAKSAQSAAKAGGLFGVWNADAPGEPLRLELGTLTGAKSFASGAGILTHVIVTVDVPGGRQLVLVDVSRTAPDIDRTWWRTVGMARSETHIARWHDASVGDTDLIGAPGDYVREPWFSGGALRFAAVQAGGIACLMDRVRDHLVGAGRASDPHQAGRLAALHGLARNAASAVRAAAEGGFDRSIERRLALVAAARVAVYEAADSAMTVAQQAVGVQGMFVEHPLAATLTDLAVYIRQPGPDAQRMRVGAAVADGTLTVSL